jgi:hypothetical protein
MKRPILSAIRAATFTIAVAIIMSVAPIAHAQTDIESSCKGSGGKYSSETIQPRFGADPVLIETCCTGTGDSGQCVTYTDGVQGPTYRKG